MSKEYLVSVESRYVVKASNETEAKAFAITAASCCGIEARGVADRVECRGSDLVCCSVESDESSK